MKELLGASQEEVSEILKVSIAKHHDGTAVPGGALVTALCRQVHGGNPWRDVQHDQARGGVVSQIVIERQKGSEHHRVHRHAEVLTGKAGNFFDFERAYAVNG